MYNTNTILNFIFIVFFCYNNNCQSNTIIVKGVIKDSQTLEGLVYASLGLKEHPIGTCSNHDGEFQLIIEDSLINEVIIVKMMGYEQREFIISEMQNKFFEIYLKQSEIQLPEIIALSKQLTAEEILKRVIKNHSKNYPYGFCNYETFFRDLMTDLHKNAKIKNCRLTEAAVNIEDYGLDAFREPKFKIHEIRNSYNYVETSKVSKALIWKINNPLDVTYNWKNQLSKNTLKKLLKSDLYSKNIINISISNNTVFYTLELSETFFKYLGKKYPTRRLQKTKKFYINSNNWAIEEAEHKWTAKLPLTDSIVFQKVQIIMQEYQKNYFLKLIDFSGSITDEYFKIGLDVNYNHKATLMVNNIILDKKSTERIRLRNALKTDLPLWNVKYNYNPDFWNNYNILLDKPIDISVKKDLEKVDPLEKQFNDGGLKNSIKH